MTALRTASAFALTTLALVLLLNAAGYGLAWLIGLPCTDSWRYALINWMAALLALVAALVVRNPKRGVA